MQKFVPLLFCGFWSFALSAQVVDKGVAKTRIPRVSLVTHKLGSTDIRLKIFQYGPITNYVFINLHDDESTSVDGVVSALENYGGTLIKIENGGKRNIRFRHQGKTYSIDPNRIFSRQGIKKTLPQPGKSNSKLVSEVEKFSFNILKLIPAETKFVIALHNNTDGNLAVNEYQPGNKRQQDASKVYVAADQDADDFFFTTDSLLFQHLAANNFNSILQNDKSVEQDGSLSVYFGGKKISYLNCETEHGKQKRAEAMIAAAIDYITTKRKD